MTQEEWVLRDDKKGGGIEKSEMEEERRDKRQNERSVGESAAFHSSPLCLFFHFTFQQSVNDVHLRRML